IDFRKSHKVESKLNSSCSFESGNSVSNVASSSCSTYPSSSVNDYGAVSAYSGIALTERDHASLLINFTRAICHSLKESVTYFPKSAQHILNRLKIRVVEKWPDDLQVSVRAVSSFLFLRLICLALLNPKQYELINEPSHDYAQRNLLLITRVLQKAANVREKRCGLSPDDDDYDLLESINSSFADIKKDVADFIEIVSAPCALPKNYTKPCDVATHFATIISLAQKHLGKIKTEPMNRVSAFLSVIEMLKNHLNRYMGEISRNTLCGVKRTSNIIL
uniref:Ras-GAP domain-containing protein n=1 Tax=Romanomermis culicivorax TaxID=13658 RepID=A0A915K5S7_ROMCU